MELLGHLIWSLAPLIDSVQDVLSDSSICHLIHRLGLHILTNQTMYSQKKQGNREEIVKRVTWRTAGGFRGIDGEKKTKEETRDILKHLKGCDIKEGLTTG